MCQAHISGTGHALSVLKSASIGHFTLHGPISVHAVLSLLVVTYAQCALPCAVSQPHGTRLDGLELCGWLVAFLGKWDLFEKTLWKYPSLGPWGCTGTLTT